MPEQFFDWAEHAPDLAEVAVAPVGGDVVLRPSALPRRVGPGAVVAYDERDRPYYREASPVVVEQGRDPWPARLLCGGVGGGALLAGAGFMFEAIAQATVGLGLLAACLALVWLLKSGGGSGGGRGVSVKGNNNRVSVR